MLVAGIDEAGRGPLAGPVTAACVILGSGQSGLVDFDATLIKDSKALSFKEREVAYDLIIKQAFAWSVVSVGHKRIDAINIREATRLAMLLAVRKVIKKLRAVGEARQINFLIDGNMKFDEASDTYGDICVTQETIVKGDRKVREISAASIIAKVTRDRLMDRLDLKYREYGLSIHKGYPTVKHRRAIVDNGPSRIHRLTFRGVAEYAGLSKAVSRCDLLEA